MRNLRKKWLSPPSYHSTRLSPHGNRYQVLTVMRSHLFSVKWVSWVDPVLPCHWTRLLSKIASSELLLLRDTNRGTSTSAKLTSMLLIETKLTPLRKHVCWLGPHRPIFCPPEIRKGVWLLPSRIPLFNRLPGQVDSSYCQVFSFFNCSLFSIARGCPSACMRACVVFSTF